MKASLRGKFVHLIYVEHSFIYLPPFIHLLSTLFFSLLTAVQSVSYTDAVLAGKASVSLLQPDQNQAVYQAGSGAAQGGQEPVRSKRLHRLLPGGNREGGNYVIITSYIFYSLSLSLSHTHRGL